MASGWDEVLKYFLNSYDFEEILNQLADLKKDHLFFCPKVADAFNWLKATPVHKVKAVIFIDSCSRSIEYATGIPLDNPSEFMRKILDTAAPKARSPQWAKQGVLLIPLSLTANVGTGAENHISIWKPLISYLINKLFEEYPEIPILLVGKKTYSYLPMIRSANVKILKIWPEVDTELKWAEWMNEIIVASGKKPIKWD